MKKAVKFQATVKIVGLDGSEKKDLKLGENMAKLNIKYDGNGIVHGLITPNDNLENFIQKENEMSTNLVTRLVCENCGHIFEPGEIGFYSDDEDVWCGNTSFMPIKTPVIHPCVCPKCNAKFETIQTYDNVFKRIVSHSSADQAKATAKCDCTTYVTIEESRMRFERYKRRKERKDYVQLPIAIVVELTGYFSYILNLSLQV